MIGPETAEVDLQIKLRQPGDPQVYRQGGLRGGVAVHSSKLSASHSGLANH